MAMIDWHLQGLNVSTCNCAWGCPCQFMSLPTSGNCRAMVGYRVIKGHFGPTALDGLCFGGMFAWPGAIHEGHGEVLPIVDARANAAQRESILKIMTGQETEPGATIFNVFASTYEKVHDPLFTAIKVDADLGGRTGHIVVDGIAEAQVEPMRNPVTGETFHAHVALPTGFEYAACEFASSTVRTFNAPIHLAWQGNHAHVAELAMTGQGVVRKRAA
jgi:hypothetical protein